MDASVSNPRTQGLNRLVRTVILGAAVVGILYLMSPRQTPHTGSLREPQQRNAMPAIELPAIGGGSWSLAANRGHVVLVNFWATWCAPCREETPGLVALAQRYETAGVKVVGIAMDADPRRVVPPFAARHKIGYPLLVPAAGFTMADSIASLPTSFLVDRQGRVARTWVGAVTARELAGDIDRLLQEN